MTATQFSVTQNYVRFGDKIRLWTKSRYETTSNSGNGNNERQGGYVGVYKKEGTWGHLFCVPPLGFPHDVLYEPCLFTVTRALVNVPVNEVRSGGGAQQIPAPPASPESRKTKRDADLYSPSSAGLTASDMYASPSKLASTSALSPPSSPSSSSSSSSSGAADMLRTKSPTSAPKIDQDVVRYGTPFCLVTADGMSINNAAGLNTGYLCPREPGTHGDCVLAFLPSETKSLEDPIMYQDRGIQLKVLSSNRYRSWYNGVVTNYKKSTSKTLGGYLACDGQGEPIDFAICGVDDVCAYMYLLNTDLSSQKEQKVAGTIVPGVFTPHPSHVLKACVIDNWAKDVTLVTGDELPAQSTLVIAFPDIGLCRVSSKSLKPPPVAGKPCEESFQVLEGPHQNCFVKIRWSKALPSRDSHINSLNASAGDKNGLLHLPHNAQGVFKFCKARLNSTHLAIIGIAVSILQIFDIEGPLFYVIILSALLFIVFDISIMRDTKRSPLGFTATENIKSTWVMNVSMPTVDGKDVVHLKDVNTSIARMNADTLLVYQITKGIVRCAEEAEQMASGAASRVSKIEVKNPHPTVGNSVLIKDYEPELFLRIRRAHLVTKDDYKNSWDFHPAAVPVMDLGAGRSGSLFLFSTDKRLLYKTIPHHEVETLLAILPDYVQHVTTKQSRMMKFYGLHRITCGSMTQYLIVAANMFHSSIGCQIQLKYDLKGRTAKKADSMHKPPNRGIYKDNQLDRSFYPTAAARSLLIDTIASDVEFLRSHDCIDYSLLVGVHNTKTCTSRHFMGNKPNLAPSWYHAGTAPDVAADEDEVYTVGIIDFLSRWTTWKKKTAHFFKSFLWEDKTLSTVNQNYYSERFMTYTKATVFPEPKQTRQSKLLMEQQQKNK